MVWKTKSVIMCVLWMPAFVGAVSTGNGAEYAWTGASSNKFSDPANWTDGVVPDASDTAIVTINLPADAHRLQIAEGDSIHLDRLVLQGHSYEERFIMVGGKLTTNESMRIPISHEELQEKELT